MREGVEAVSPMVCAIARFADAAEGGVGNAGVHHDVFNGYTAGCGVVEDWCVNDSEYVKYCGGRGE